MEWGWSRRRKASPARLAPMVDGCVPDNHGVNLRIVLEQGRAAGRDGERLHALDQRETHAE